MKRKDGFVKRSIGGRDVAVAVGERAATFNGMITLNGSASFLWDALSSDKTEAELVEALLCEYAVDRERAEADVRAFVAALSKAGLLDD